MVLFFVSLSEKKEEIEALRAVKETKKMAPEKVRKKKKKKTERKTKRVSKEMNKKKNSSTHPHESLGGDHTILKSSLSLAGSLPMISLATLEQ